YFSFTAIEQLASRHDLKLIDVEELPTHGGSLRVYLAGALSHHPVARSVRDLLDREQALGYRSIATFGSFADQVRKTKRNLLSLLVGIKEGGKRICGYGAPGKGNTLLNYCGIGTDFLDFTVDRNPYKQGKYTPGTHIPIRHPEELVKARPDYVLILPWNLKEEILATVGKTPGLE